MGQLLITLSVLMIVFASLIYSAVGQDESTHILVRDEWWSAKKYNDRPRFFNWKSGSDCPAKLFYLNCNGCRCIRDNIAACTKKGCGTPQIHNYADGMECPAGKPFYFKCNDCTCHEDGKSAKCTTKDCPEPTLNEQDSTS